jgi:hypothetical protein
MESEEFDRICQNCSNFIQDSEDLLAGLGICIIDENFEPFLDEIFENGDFSKCYELYLNKRFHGDREPCEQFELPEYLEIPEGEDTNTYINVEQMKHANVDEVVKYFYDTDKAIVKRAIWTIEPYFYMENEGAYEGLINYYMSLGPAESLDEVHFRVEVVGILSSTKEKKRTIDALINELYRTPSNNTTNQLYRKILEVLKRCPLETVEDPLLELLAKKKYSPKMKNRILEVATEREIVERWFW